jgi:hypothetical protein
MAGALPEELSPARYQGSPACKRLTVLGRRPAFPTAVRQPSHEAAGQVLRVEEAVGRQALRDAHGHLCVVRDRADRPLLPTGPLLVLSQPTITGADGQGAHALDRLPQRITHGSAQQRSDKPCPLRHRLFGVPLHGGLPGVYVSNVVDAGVRAVATYLRFRGGHWRTIRV